MMRVYINSLSPISGFDTCRRSVTNFDPDSDPVPDSGREKAHFATNLHKQDAPLTVIGGVSSIPFSV